MKVIVDLQLECGRCNGSMQISISDSHDVLVTMDDLPLGIVDIPLVIDWPNTLNVQVSGKDNNTDTENDEHGNIIANKFVRLVGVRVNGIDIIERCLYDICTWRLEGHDSRQETFWDQNGQAQIRFDHDNPLRFMIHLNNVLYFR